MVQDQSTNLSPQKQMIFRMKQFEIRQEQSALKVGTDGVLLGAYVGARSGNATKVLDVGTGTGVVALMLAQSIPHSTVDGIEIDIASADEAKANVRYSIFSDRVRIIAGDFGSFSSAPYQYDLIVSNPPYFTDTHMSADERTTSAKHIGRLTPDLFFDRARGLLSHRGRVAIIIATSSLSYFVASASQYGFSIEHLVYVRTVGHRPPKRVLLVYTQETPTYCGIEYLTIHSGTGRHDYTPEYRRLLAPFLTIF